MLGKLKLKLRTKMMFMLTEESNKVSNCRLNNKMICKVFSYTYHYHKVVAVMSQLNRKVLKLLEDKQKNYI